MYCINKTCIDVFFFFFFLGHLGAVQQAVNAILSHYHLIKLKDICASKEWLIYNLKRHSASIEFIWVVFRPSSILTHNIWLCYMLHYVPQLVANFNCFYTEIAQ